MAQTKQMVICPYEKCKQPTSYANVASRTFSNGSGYDFDCEYCGKPIRIRTGGENGETVDQTPIALAQSKKNK